MARLPPGTSRCCDTSEFRVDLFDLSCLRLSQIALFSASTFSVHFVFSQISWLSPYTYYTFYTFYAYLHPSICQSLHTSKRLTNTDSLQCMVVPRKSEKMSEIGHGLKRRRQRTLTATSQDTSPLHAVCNSLGLQQFHFARSAAELHAALYVALSILCRRNINSPTPISAQTPMDIAPRNVFFVHFYVTSAKSLLRDART